MKKTESAYTVSGHTNQHSHYRLWFPQTAWCFPQTLKIELPNDPATSLLGIYSEKSILRKDSCTPKFIITLFTIGRTWWQPTCPLRGEQVQEMWYIHAMEFYSATKEWNNVICSSLDEPRDYNTKWNVRQKLICGILKKKIQMNLFTKQKQTHRHRKHTMVTKGENWGWSIQ